jgi:hypothetical protein
LRLVEVLFTAVPDDEERAEAAALTGLSDAEEKRIACKPLHKQYEAITPFPSLLLLGLGSCGEASFFLRGS